MKSQTTAHCPHCGAELRPGVKFCPKCGASLAGNVSEGAGSNSSQLSAPEKSSTLLLTTLVVVLILISIFAFFLLPVKNAAGPVQTSVFVGPLLNSQGNIVKTPEILSKPDQPGELKWNDALTGQYSEKQGTEEPAQLESELSSESKEGYTGENPGGLVQSSAVVGQLTGKNGTVAKSGVVVSPGHSTSAAQTPKKKREQKKAKNKKGKRPASSEMPFRTAIAYEPSFSVNARSSSQVKNAIVKALKGRGWVPSIKSSRHIRATLHIRTHTVVSDIYYNAKTVSIYYRSSKNLKYRKIRGWKIIHKNYNNWVKNIQHDILAYLKK